MIHMKFSSLISSENKKNKQQQQKFRMLSATVLYSTLRVDI